MVSGSNQGKAMKPPASFMVWQLLGVLFVLPSLAYLRGGSLRDKVVSLLPVLTNTTVVWGGIVLGCICFGLALAALLANVKKLKAQASNGSS
jgi:hypothetical protein